ncbi:hypothetical protein SVA_1049 [Sulfurifustis variabilis]|uniref:DUF763 domain-containing protein n=1 Tax=Sulfurifustis variabilis TaxID=1675686 RepID=A0A1B4V278_9GAMM|nr:DUF763 domain-containing protein [Sulfurifustis variabilis]BAU47628.1 hypothetical protein SVA_1049 [Sulfurifustis variabilis]
MRTGFAQLPLHGGKAPAWLFRRMVRLARAVVCHVVDEHGPDEVLARLSDPYWFQALGCVLGFDWHSSGVTTTTCGAIKEGVKGLEQELGLYAAGGKGAASRRTPGEIEAACVRLARAPDALVQASRLAAKVDSAAVQDGYELYHHSFFFTRNGRWCVVQQGLNDGEGTARRYHWLGSRVESFVNEPHAAVCCDRRGEVLNLVAAESDGSRAAIAELARTPDRDVARVVERLPTLVLPGRHPVASADIDPRYLHKILVSTYERAPADFAALLAVPGVGAKTLRALALIAELIYGSPASTRDPARFSFAHGGKDGTPYAVDRETYDRTIAVLHDALGRAAVDAGEKRQALRRLAAFAPPGG